MHLLFYQNNTRPWKKQGRNQLYKREGPARKQRPHNKKPAGSRRLQALVVDTYFFGVISLFSLGSLIFGVCVS